MTVEAAFAFPVFFFAVMYLIQMFLVVRAEVIVAEAAITSAGKAAVYSYAAERLAEGEGAEAETLLSLFEPQIVRDAAMTSVFYAHCDKEALEQAHVGQGLGGIWVDTEDDGEKTRAVIRYRVKLPNVLNAEKARYYTMRIVYRNWTGEGSIGAGAGHGTAEDTGEKTVYMTEHGNVYHEKRTCSHIKIDTVAVSGNAVEKLRNDSGAKYYACEFCSPVLSGATTVYITEYGIRYHGVSSCSAIKRNVKEYRWEEVKDRYRACNRCVSTEKKGEL